MCGANRVKLRIDDGMYRPPPIQTQAGRDLRSTGRRPLPSGMPRIGKCAATCVLSGDLSALNRVSR